MRKIKFRAWDDINNVMRYNVAFDLNSRWWVYEGEYTSNGELCAGLIKVGSKADSHVMQFTGLKDRNGREIYEGDICKCPVTRNKHIHGDFTFRSVKWKSDSFCWVLDGEFAWLTFNGAFGEEGDYVDYSDNGPVINIEVIGNIYENPDLLEPK